MEVIKKSPKIIGKVTEFLKKGGVVICPTDTVYGFLADAGDKKAVDKIYKIKNRPKSKPLPVFVSSIKMARELAEIDVRQMKYLKKFWPGPYTFVLKAKSYKLQAQNTIALRLPKHSLLQKLLKKINRPLAQTSVNISDKSPLNRISDIIKQFSGQDILIVDGGDIKKAKSSKILDLTREKIKTLRR